MKVNNQNEINFGAKYLSPAQIIRRNPYTMDKSLQRASIIEIDGSNKNDIDALKYIEKHGDTHFFAGASEIAEIITPIDWHKRLIALTTQVCDFEYLDSNKILGMALIDKKSKNHINVEILETLPYKNQFKHVATGIINYLKDTYDKITLFSTTNAIDFYRKNNFKSSKPNEYKLYWKRDLKEIAKREKHKLLNKIFNWFKK